MKTLNITSPLSLGKRTAQESPARVRLRVGLRRTDCASLDTDSRLWPVTTASRSYSHGCGAYCVANEVIHYGSGSLIRVETFHSDSQVRGLSVVARKVRFISGVIVTMVALASCAPGVTYVAPTPRQRLESDIRYCRNRYPTYLQAREASSQGGGSFYGSAALSSTITTYEYRCVGIALPPLRTYEELLMFYGTD